MKESFGTPLLLALLFVGITLGISSLSTPQQSQLAAVGGASDISPTPSLPVVFSVAVSSDVNCEGATPTRTVGFFTDPVGGGYFSLFGTGGTDLGDREPGLYQFSPGSYTWEGKARTGFMRSQNYVGNFTITASCGTSAAPSTPSPTPTSADGKMPASVTVSVGTACAMEKGMTQVAVATEPRGSATVSFQKDNGNVITSTSQGIVYLPNGSYTWKAESAPGFVVSGASSGVFTLNVCPTHGTVSVLPGSTCDLVEEGVPVTFGLLGDARVYFSVTDSDSGETIPVDVGVEYLRNGTYTWNVIAQKGEPVVFTGPTEGNFTISSCKGLSATPYVPPKSGTILFFREGKLIEPLVAQKEKIAVRVDVPNASAVELERIGKDTREVIGTMTKDPGTTRWLLAWNVGGTIPGEYTIIARVKNTKGESVTGSRMVTILARDTPPLGISTEKGTTSFDLTPAEFSAPTVASIDGPVFKKITTEGEHLSLPVRGVADLVSTADILLARGTLPEAIQSPEDLRAFCSTETNDDVCLGFLPESLRDEAQAMVVASRKEIARALKARPKVSVDEDKDGLDDFDELSFYGTDPAKGDTDGDGRRDGDEFLSGDDPLKKSTKAVRLTFENPVFGGEERPEFLAVSAVRIGTSSEKAVIFSGTALPHTVVTLAVYSEPVFFRVLTDAEGAWTQGVKESLLPDGVHKTYVSLTDSAGRIVIKSAPLLFAKRNHEITLDSALHDMPYHKTFSERAVVYAGIALFCGGIAAVSLGLHTLRRSRKKKGDGIIR